MNLLGIGGSLRREAYSTAVLRTLREKCADKAELTLFSLRDIPLYDQDLDGESPPEPVKLLKAAIEKCDGLIVCSPEYNYGMSGVLKNAIDWASRPGFKSPLKGKPVVLMTTSPGYTGGVRAQYQLRETLSATLSRVIARPQVVIAGVHEKVKDGQLVDTSTIAFALAAIDDLIAEIQLVRKGVSGG